MADFRFQLKWTRALLTSLIISCIVIVTSRPTGSNSPSDHGSGQSGSSQPGFHWHQSPSSSSWTPDQQAFSQSYGITPFHDPSNILGHNPAWNYQGQGSVRPLSWSHHALNYAPTTTFSTVGPVAERPPTDASWRLWDLLAHIRDFQGGSFVSNPGDMPSTSESRLSSAMPLTTMEHSTHQPNHPTWQQPASSNKGHLSLPFDDKNTFERWVERLKKATGRSSLQVLAVNPTADDRKIFVAHYSDLQGDQERSQGALQEPLADQHRGQQVGHFVVRLKDVSTIPIQYGITGKDQERRYVYLDSRQNKLALNDKYFKNHMDFLPLEPNALTQDMLNKLNERKNPKILPPIEVNGFPVIMLRHSSEEIIRQIEQATRKLSSDYQIVSLWSPLLVDKFHTTVILHGFGQLRAAGILETIDHLNALAKAWDKTKFPLSSSYYFAEDFPNASPFGVHTV
ncbi:uncharacterized protein UTRI_10547_B [Ustilago trichophora]|uniref:Effector family protein Eff1 n=1 Tax=Ustilago trichophora TaxID=86804 RepID=A0A5C3E939_9BASI|nr:uncharacterized protein UTRI_10547_B [Ustilago trichophora]